MELQQYKELVGDLLVKHYARLPAQTDLNDAALRAALSDGVPAYEVVNHYASENQLRRVDLDIGNAFPHARLSNLDQYRATQRLSLMSLRTIVDDAAASDASGDLVIFSEQESRNGGAGFWSNRCGWVTLQDATRFSEAEARSWALPLSAGNDARWLAAAEVQDLRGVIA